MKMKEFVEEVEQEIIEEKKEIAKEVLKERIKEIGSAKKVLAKLEKQYTDLLEKDVDEIAEEDEEY